MDQESLKAIEDLHRMKSEGIITEAEFEQSKQKILFGQRPPKTTSAKTSNVQLPAVSDHIGWIVLPLRRYADFQGRSSLKEFWMFQLIHVILGILFGIMVGGNTNVYGETSSTGEAFFGLIVIALLGLAVPQLAVIVRRFHDQNRSGWFILLGLIPYLGALLVYLLMLIPGIQGENRFGPDPKL